MKTKLISSRVVFHANPTLWQESDWEKTTIDTSSRKCLEQFEKLNRGGLWARTFSELLIGMEGWYSKRCKLTWKVKGTKYKRLYFQLFPLAHHTDEIEFGLLLKTPCAMDAYSEKMAKKEQSFGNSGTLAQEVATGFIYKRGILPTPTAYDFNTARTPKKWKEDKEKWQRKGINLQLTLKQKVVLDNPTGGTSQLSPQFVAEMMGFPKDWTESPFLNGEQNQSKVTETP